MNPAGLREVAERALAHAAGADAQVTVAWERGLIATGGGTRADEAVAVEVTAVEGGAVGHSSTSATDDEALERVVASALRAASAGRDAGAVLPDPPAEPAPPRPHDGYDPAVAELAPDAIELPEHTIWEAAVARALVRSTRGIDSLEQRSLVRGTYDRRKADRGVHLTRAAPSAAGLDLAVLAAEGTRLGAAAPQGSAQPGESAVVLGAQAVADVLEWLRWTFSANGAARERQGSRIAASCVNLSDSPRFPGTLARSFDVEGVARRPVPLMQDGVAHRVVWDTASAARQGDGAQSTGHAGQPARPLPFPHHLVLVGGGAADEAELARKIDAGLFVAAIPGLEAAEEDALRGHACGVFAIRGGEIAEPLADAAVEVRPLDVLAAAQALTATQHVVPTHGGARHVGASVVPALRAGGGIRVL